MADFKANLRKTMRAKRLQVSLSERRKASDAAAAHLLMSPLFLQSQKIACYHSTLEEMDTAPLLSILFQHRKHVFLPAITPHKSLLFYQYAQDSTLQPNQFGILEPLHQQLIHAHELDLILLPLIAFDFHGHRIGYGGAYYDRTLADISPLPFLLGYGYAFQEVAVISPDPWDISLNGYLTEKGIFNIKF